MQDNNIVKSIGGSSKYKDLSEDVVQKVVNEFSSPEIKNEDLERKVKNLLHQAWGAFYSTRPNFKKLENSLKFGLANNIDQKTLLTNILRVHSSTNERLSIMEAFYRDVFTVTGIPESILDLGCGLNPLTIPWMNLPNSTRYIAVDIDQAQMAFIKNAAEILNWSTDLDCVVGSAFADNFKPVDVVFMFKLIPVLEKLTKSFNLAEFLCKFQCKFFVITYPMGSLSGKNKGMKDFYTNKMSDFFKENPYKYIRLQFANELVYVICHDHLLQCRT